jgi:hypothetical protein
VVTTSDQSSPSWAVIRAKLLEDARGGCCTHRLNWLRVVRGDNRALKFEPLHVHHVEFRSLGGSDHPDNLIPLCPTCHTMLHDARRAGADFLSDDQLRECWEAWKGIRVAVPAYQSLGEAASHLRVKLLMQVYFLDAEFSVPASLSYAEARTERLRRTVDVLREIDPHFPFVGGGVEAAQWALSSDSDATAGKWLVQPAIDVFTQSTQPLRAEAPILFALNRDDDWRFSTQPQHRGL